MTQRQSQQSSQVVKERPRAGDTFRCEQCGMEVEIKQDCKCEQGEPHMECCGQPLSRQ